MPSITVQESHMPVPESDIQLPPIPWTQRYGRTLWGVIGVVGFIGLWQIGIWLGFIDPVFVSSPVGVATAGAQMLGTNEFWTNLGVTLRALGVGLVLACVLGVVVGMLTGWFRTLNALAEPLIAALYAVPYIAFLPMIIIWTGIGNTSRTLIVLWAAFFPLLINTMQGVQEVNKDYLRVGDSYCASRWQVFLGIVFPASLPYILAGLRQSIGRGLVGAIVAEFFMASAGIGYFINLESNNLQMGQAFAGIVVISLIGVTLVALVRQVENRFSNWS